MRLHELAIAHRLEEFPDTNTDADYWTDQNLFLLAQALSVDVNFQGTAGDRAELSLDHMST